MNRIRLGSHVANFIRSIADDADAHAAPKASVTPDQLRDWANCIDPQGFLVDGLTNAELARELSIRGELHGFLEAACELYGFTLVLDDDVASRLRATTETDSHA